MSYSIQLKPIVDGYFVYSRTKPKKAYTEDDIQKIVTQGGLLIANMDGNYVTYLSNKAAEYGVSPTAAAAYLNDYPQRAALIVQAAKNSIYMEHATVGEVLTMPFKWVGNTLGSIVGGTLGGFLKKALPPLIIIAVLYFAFKYANKKI